MQQNLATWKTCSSLEYLRLSAELETFLSAKFRTSSVIPKALNLASDLLSANPVDGISLAMRHSASHQVSCFYSFISFSGAVLASESSALYLEIKFQGRHGCKKAHSQNPAEKLMKEAVSCWFVGGVASWHLKRPSRAF